MTKIKKNLPFIKYYENTTRDFLREAASPFFFIHIYRCLHIDKQRTPINKRKEFTKSERGERDVAFYITTALLSLCKRIFS